MTTFRIFANQKSATPNLRVGSRLGKYRLTKRLGEGGFATVFAATDTIEGRQVAIKIPDCRYISNSQSMDDLQREVRIMARLEHPGILQLKDAQFIDENFIMVFPIGDESLADRLCRRMSRAVCIEYLIQMVEAVAFAHEHRVLHRDIKPENFILFPDQVIRLTDFGLARLETVGHEVSASGTLGYMAPEQAMGHPSYRSDVFSLGLVLYRLLSGELPEYPFEAPLPGYNRLRRGLSADLVALIRKSIDPAPRKRFRDAVAMKNALVKIRYPLSDRSIVQRTPEKRLSRRTNRQAA
ncbi:serine/threonine-protein kinase [Roseiconus lacunae]|uniref:Serine/threonine-protein kinase n=1 Tax=Roseiconus lacunae TaxID=2605694 RepID=A0ABT7PLN0_9BACT|nr:serine/threonine-protein kinase [Roseiconus lacunae]MCD0460865.1 serine/threonine protein kinase [Roseiconus lacunae]MDM4017380.1 serine/threonine-protein kinase [Roseiconus lacunae]WRQ48709.1 serine/threonine-protein kinase [Stieleria sp. HD01]